MELLLFRTSVHDFATIDDEGTKLVPTLASWEAELHDGARNQYSLGKLEMPVIPALPCGVAKTCRVSGSPPHEDTVNEDEQMQPFMGKKSVQHPIGNDMDTDRVEQNIGNDMIRLRRTEHRQWHGQALRRAEHRQ